MDRHGPILAIVIAAALLGTFVLVAKPASAHTHVIIGPYELIVGWRNEPATAGYLNGLDLGIEQHHANNTTSWVIGVEGNLTAVLATGPYTVMKAIDPQADRPGWYTFDVLLTRAGRYSVHLNGTLGSTTVNQTVNLDDVGPASDLAFPIADPTTSDLQSRLDAQLASLQTQLTAALALGVVGILIALASLAAYARLARRQPKAP
ncbi:MAG: hypothetical protein L3J78_00670 [Thermoplasmata archaeon]|nr:hypothetical protein [Thermoplasmata archaeon]